MMMVVVAFANVNQIKLSGVTTVGFDGFLFCFPFLTTGFGFFPWSANVTLRFEPLGFAVAVAPPEPLVDEWLLSVAGAVFAFALFVVVLGPAVDSVVDGCGGASPLGFVKNRILFAESLVILLKYCRLEVYHDMLHCKKNNNYCEP